MIAVRKSIGLKYQSRQLATPGHVIFAYNIVQRCLSLLVWLLGVDYVLCTPCTAGSKRHRLSGSLLWVYVTISIFRGVGLSFHAFNESRPPWADVEHVRGYLSLCGDLLGVKTFKKRNVKKKKKNNLVFLNHILF